MELTFELGSCVQVQILSIESKADVHRTVRYRGKTIAHGPYQLSMKN